MNREVLRVVGYRFAATFRRRRAGYLALVLIVGLLGGVAMASVAAARRTQSSYPAYLASTNPSDLTMSVYGTVSGAAATNYSPALARAIAALPLVRRVEAWVGAAVAPLRADGSPIQPDSINPAASISGLYFHMDRATAIAGRMADPARPDEFVTTPEGARILGLRVGQVVPMGLFSLAQLGTPGFVGPVVKPLHSLTMRLVGLVQFNDKVIEDDADRLPANVLYTPALARSVVASGGAFGTWYGMQLTHGDRDVPAVEHELISRRVLPRGSVYNFRVTSLGEAKVERALRPESIALGVFGAIAALAALAVAALSIGRQVHSEEADRQVLRAMGASPVATAADSCVGLIGAVVAGTLAAGSLALGLSLLAPLGPVRPLYPSGGLAADWTVLGFGSLGLVVALGAVAALVAYRVAPHRTGTDPAVGGRGSALARAAASAGLPAPATTGVRFALEAGRGARAVPVRSALTGAVLAVVLVVATVTFGGSLRTLVSHPALYGWNWSYVLSSFNNVPPQARTLLDHDPLVAGWSPYVDLNVQVDGQNLPVLVGDSHPRVSPPILTGHAVDGDRQMVLGSASLARLHKRVGDQVVVSYGSPADAPFDVPPTRLTVVGTATLPAIAGSATLSDHTSMGVGALIPDAIAPALKQASASPDPTLDGPPLVFVRLRPGVGPAAGLADLRRIAAAADRAFAADPQGVGDTVTVVGVQRPAEIVNYGSTGATPILLASALAAGAVVALGMTLVASVRRRRRDLALLKTLGFTQGQLASAVAWQASVAAVTGAVVGVPLGIAAGRWLWLVFARAIYVVPRPSVPWSVAAVAGGALVVANLVAAVPGRMAARTPAALALRAE